jgi:hypothetical protein
LCFEDVVDFTVGWSVDVDQSPAVIAHCQAVLIALQPYWLQALGNACTLMRQFLDDAESHIEVSTGAFHHDNRLTSDGREWVPRGSRFSIPDV